MARQGSRWVDPAPLEIARPRLPWWALLPWWVKLAVSPLALLWVACWLCWNAGRIMAHYPLTISTVGLAYGLYDSYGLAMLGVIAVVIAAALAAWRWKSPVTFARYAVPQYRTELRRLFVYAPEWRSVMRLSELAKSKRGKEHRPKLGAVRADSWRDRVQVKMIKGQAPEQWEQRASGLAHSFRANSCRIRVVKPGRLELDFVHSDPLVRPIPVPELSVDPSAADLRRVVIGKTETGQQMTLQLLGTHVLAVGVSGAGKGSLLWSTVWQLAPSIRAGLVQLYGIDPKGGMELGQAPEAFTRVVYDNGPDAVALLEDLAAEVKRRAESYRGRRRSWSPESGDPFVLLVVDELADAIAYQTDKQLRERAVRAVQAITSQGRAPGVTVLGLLQDPRKEIIAFRHLFNTRIALRLDEPQQVDMVLGDGVRLRGAVAHEIPESTPGVAWVKEEGRREPVRARCFHITDDHLAQLAGYLSGRLSLPIGGAA